MRVLSLLCGENIIRDVEGGQITIYNLLDDISAVGFPLLLSRFCIYFFSEKEAGDDDVQEIALSISNNDQIIFTNKVRVPFNQRQRSRSVVKFNGLVVIAPGTLYIRLNKLDGNSLWEGQIILTAIQPAQVTVANQ